MLTEVLCGAYQANLMFRTLEDSKLMRNSLLKVRTHPANALARARVFQLGMLVIWETDQCSPSDSHPTNIFTTITGDHELELEHSSRE